MKRLLYISCHITMETEELEIFSSLGFHCVSVGNFLNEGAPFHTKEVADYGSMNWTKHDWREPKFNRDVELTEEFVRLNPRFIGITPALANLPQSFLNKFDVIVIAHYQNYLSTIVPRVDTNRTEIIYCTLGQTDSHMELTTANFREAIHIVRYGESEKSVRNCAGTDFVIPCSVSSDFDLEWEGSIPELISIVRAAPKRPMEVGYPTILEVLQGIPAKIFGTGNEEVPAILHGGALTYRELIEAYNRYRCFFTAGSYPGSLTLTFAEAFYSGIPVLCPGKELARQYKGAAHFYDIDRFIDHGITGFVSNDPKELKAIALELISNHSLAKSVSTAAKQVAVSHFSRAAITEKWRSAFKNIGIL